MPVTVGRGGLGEAICDAPECGRSAGFGFGPGGRKGGVWDGAWFCHRHAIEYDAEQVRSGAQRPDQALFRVNRELAPGKALVPRDGPGAGDLFG